MDEMDKYRERIERRYHSRRKRERYIEGGRRRVDYKSPPIFYWSDLWLLIPLAGASLAILFFSGCVAVKNCLEVNKMYTKFLDMGYNIVRLSYTNREEQDANGNEISTKADFEMLVISPSMSDETGFQPAETIRLHSYDGKKLRELAKEILAITEK